MLVVTPTYNERATLSGVVQRLRTSAPEADVLVVDDASPDGTGEIADRLAGDDRQVHVLHRNSKDGLGRAYVAGFEWGLERGYDVLVAMDADGSHQPEQLRRLLTALDDADVVIGSRWVPGGVVRNWPLRRELLSRGANVYARLALGIPVRDATAGYRAYRSVVLDKIGIAEVASQGYCFQIDLVLRALRAGSRVVEVPIEFVERAEGTSKMSGHVVAEALTRVTLWGLRHPFGGGRR
ncbi:MAG: glycosyltransferase [Streptosporangiales bacterium]|nr:glycosyltransferase [Streptosporangiales bacterium]